MCYHAGSDPGKVGENFMQILRASEDYLETMLMMQQQDGYITMDKDGLITLTASGMAIAENMLDRHHTLTRFLMALGIDAATAEADACKIEHDISQKTFDAICAHAKAHL